MAINMGFALICTYDHPRLGLSKSEAVEFAKKMGFSEKCAEQAGEWMVRLYDLFIEKDVTLVEINPMAEDLLGRSKCYVLGASVT